MPVIPAWIVRSNLNDSRRIPYLLIWKDQIHSGAIKEAVRLARYVEPSNSRVSDNCVELKRTDGSVTVLRFVWRMPPRNGGRALLLPFEARATHHLIGGSDIDKDLANVPAAYSPVFKTKASCEEVMHAGPPPPS